VELLPLGTTHHFLIPGEPPRVLSVTFTNDSKQTIVRMGHLSRTLPWKGGGYRPRSKQQIIAAVEKFLQAENSDASLDEVNAELQQPGRQAPRTKKPKNQSDRQLPAGDRS